MGAESLVLRKVVYGSRLCGVDSKQFPIRNRLGRSEKVLRTQRLDTNSDWMTLDGFRGSNWAAKQFHNQTGLVFC